MNKVRKFLLAYRIDIVDVLAAILNLSGNPMTVEVFEDMMNKGASSSKTLPMFAVRMQQRLFDQAVGRFESLFEMIPEEIPQGKVELSTKQIRTISGTSYCCEM